MSWYADAVHPCNHGLHVVQHAGHVLCRSPIAHDTFLHHFWPCFNTLKAKADEEVGMPAYFRFLTLLGAAVLGRCGLGGGGGLTLL